MQVRAYNSAFDYDVVKQWWHDWAWIPEPTPNMLSQNGLIVFEDDKPLAAGFVYQTDSVICWVEHIVTDKDIPKFVRAKAVQLLIKKLTEKAEDLGFIVAMVSLEHKGLIKMFENNDFIKTDTNVTNLMKVL